MKALFPAIQNFPIASTDVHLGKRFSNFFGHDPEKEKFIRWDLVYTQMHTPKINAMKNTYSCVT